MDREYSSSSKANEIFHGEWTDAAEKNGCLARESEDIVDIRSDREIRGSRVHSKMSVSYRYPRRGDTLIICAAGPSLDNELSALHRVKRTPIWVVNRFFEHAPKFRGFSACVVADVHSKPIENPEVTEGKDLFSGLFTNPEFNSTWRGKRWWVLPQTTRAFRGEEREKVGRDRSEKHPEIKRELDRQVARRFIYGLSNSYYMRYRDRPQMCKRLGMCQTGGNVSTQTLSIAMLCGYKNIVFVGHDFGFTDNVPAYGEHWGTPRCPYTPRALQEKTLWNRRKHREWRKKWVQAKCEKKNPKLSALFDLEEDGKIVHKIMPLSAGCKICGGHPTDNGHYRRLNKPYHLYKTWTENLIIKMAHERFRFYNCNEEGMFGVHSKENAGGRLQPGDRFTCMTFARLSELLKMGVVE